MCIGCHTDTAHTDAAPAASQCSGQCNMCIRYHTDAAHTDAAQAASSCSGQCSSNRAAQAASDQARVLIKCCIVLSKLQDRDVA